MMNPMFLQRSLAFICIHNAIFHLMTLNCLEDTKTPLHGRGRQQFQLKKIQYSLPGTNNGKGTRDEPYTGALCTTICN